MKEFLIAFSMLSLLVSVCLMLYPETGTKKYIKLCMSLTLLLSVISFITGFSLKTAPEELRPPEISDGGDLLDRYYIEKTKENIIAGIKNTVINKYKIAPEKITVSVLLDTADKSNIQITYIEITVCGIENIVKTTRIHNDMESLFGCECKVIYSEEETIVG